MSDDIEKEDEIDGHIRRLINLTILGQDEAEMILELGGSHKIKVSSSGEPYIVVDKRNPYTHLVSIVSPEKERAKSLTEFKGESLLLEFDDVSSHDFLPRAYDFGYLPPEHRHVRAIREWAQKHIASYVLTSGADDKPIELLIHCAAGISRSTAAAIIILTGAGMTDTEAFDYLYEVRDIAAPNQIMLDLEDQISRADGQDSNLLRTLRHREKLKYDDYERKYEASIIKLCELAREAGLGTDDEKDDSDIEGT